MRTLFVLASVLLLSSAGCSQKQEAKPPTPMLGCADHAALADLKAANGIVMLVAAADVVAGADSLCDAVLGVDWRTVDPYNLADDVTPDTLAAALEWVCGRVQSLPLQEREVAIAKLDAWCDVNNWIASQSSVEAIATAVAFVPEVEDLVADKIVERHIPKDMIGDSLASAEHTQLHYELTRRLAAMPDEQREAVMAALHVQIGKYGEE
jgi:hypothetical protein